MLILPGELKRWKALVPLRRSEWQLPSSGATMQKTWWRANALLDDGSCCWCGITEDREDFDLFVDALLRFHLLGTPMPTATKRLLRGTPHEWHEGIECRGYKFDQYWHLYAFPTEWGQGVPEREFHVPLDWNNRRIIEFPNLDYWIDQEWSFAPGTYLTTASASPWPVPAAWNVANNLIETIGPGGSGGLAGSSPAGSATGGGGGGYSSSPNVPLSAPTPQPFAVGDGGGPTPGPKASNTVGAAGTADTCFGGTTLPAAGTLVGAQKGGGGGASASSPVAGGTGGATPTAKGTTKQAGGSGGVSTNPAPLFPNKATGGGGAGGSLGAGGSGAAAPPSSGSAQTAGGDGGPPAGGVNPGGAGTSMDPTHGSGAGSVAALSANTAAGGNYGGGSGGLTNPGSPGSPPTQSTGKGGPGLIAITNTLARGLFAQNPMVGIGDGGSFFADRLAGKGAAGGTIRVEPRSPMMQAKGRSFTGWPKCLS